MAQPIFNMVAGPNGSGKTTLTNELRRRKIGLGIYINADEIVEECLSSGIACENVAEHAQKIALNKVDNCIETEQSFTFETVMSHPSKLDMLKKARSRAFRRCLFFVGTEDPFINVARVEQRVRLGGHNVPEEKIKNRYRRTMDLLRSAAELCDNGVIFDNSYPKREANSVNNLQSPLMAICGFKNDGFGIQIVNYSEFVTNWVKQYLY